jgi:hypothetical protein
MLLSIFRAEDGDSLLLRNVGIYLQVYMASKPTRSSSPPPREPQISHRYLGLLFHVVFLLCASVSQEHTVSIIRAEVRSVGKYMVYVRTGDGSDQSEPWDEEGRWSCIWANRKEPF